jgi:hypothetical protein
LSRRSFEHRREVFEDFCQAVKALARRAYDHGYGFDDTPELPFDWNADAAAKLNRLKLYVDRRSYIAAEHAYDAAFWWGHHTKYNDPGRPRILRAATEVRRCRAGAAGAHAPGSFHTGGRPLVAATGLPLRATAYR